MRSEHSLVSVYSGKSFSGKSLRKDSLWKQEVCSLGGQRRDCVGGQDDFLRSGQYSCGGDDSGGKAREDFLEPGAFITSFSLLLG